MLKKEQPKVGGSMLKKNGELNMKKLNAFIKQEYKYVNDLQVRCGVPDIIDDFNEDDYLLPSSGKKRNGVLAPASGPSLGELQDRMATIKNKMRQKKRPTTERAKAKREAKKLKKNKKFKKVLVSAAKSLKNETNKQIKTEESGVNGGDTEAAKSQIKRVKQKPIFNAEGKIVFSKFDFAAQPGMKAKKSHQNPREILKKIKDTDRKINELKEHGNEEKAAEFKNDLAWKKAFDKVEGKKVKDDPQLLYKAIKKRKVEKKKAKTKWAERKERVETGKDKRQKKRQDNIEKRNKDKKNRKLKKASKKGRVIPGF